MKRNLVYGLLAIVLCVFSGMPVKGQLGAYWETGRIAVAPTNDGGFYFFGNLVGGIDGPGPFCTAFLVRYDSNYFKVDQREILPLNFNNWSWPKVGNMIEDGNGEILFSLDHERGLKLWDFSPLYSLPSRGGTLIKLGGPGLISELDRDSIVRPGYNWQYVHTTGILPFESGGGFYCLKEWQAYEYWVGNLPMIPGMAGSPYSKQTVLIKYNNAFEPTWARDIQYFTSTTYGSDGADPIIWAAGDSGVIYLKGSLKSGQTADFVGIGLTITAPYDDYFYIAAIDSNGNGKWLVEEFAQNPTMNNAVSYHAISADNGEIYTTVSRPGYSATNSHEYLITRGFPGMPIQDSVMFEQPQSNAQQGGFRELKMLDNGNLRVFGKFRDSLIIDSTNWLSASGERCFVAELDTGLNMLSACLLDPFFQLDEGDFSFAGNGSFFYARRPINDDYKVLGMNVNCNQIWMEEIHTSLTENDIPQNFSPLNLFPNPATDQINFEMEAPTPGVYKVRIFNLLGAEMSSTELIATSTQLQSTLDISQLSKGSYFLSVEKEGQVFTRGFVKQ